MKLISAVKRKGPELVLVFLAIIILGLPFAPWGFHSDDFSFVWRGQFQSIADVINFFHMTSVYNLLHGSNFIPQNAHFFSVLYRP